MVWVLRIVVGMAIVAYGGWLAWPAIEAALSGAQAEAVLGLLAPDGDFRSRTAAGLLVTVVLLYVAGGLAALTGGAWAPGAYFAAVVGEIALRLEVASATASPPAIDLAARTEAALRPLGLIVDPTPISLASLLAVGLCVLALGLWRGQKGAALTRVWTQPPVWA